MLKAIGFATSVFGLLYIYGLALLVLGLGIQWLFHGLPNWTWWQFGFAPVALGIAAMVAEGLFLAIAKLFAFNRPDLPKWRDRVNLALVFVLSAALIIGPALYNIGRQ
jgi:hypothetical protein